MKLFYTLVFSFFSVILLAQPTDTCKISIGSDFSVCTDTKVGISFSSPLKNPSIIWSSVFTSTCNTCKIFVPDTKNAGKNKVIVSASSGACAVSDTLELTILTAKAATSNYLDSVTICNGQKVTLGNSNDASQTYSWSSFPSGYTSNINNPNVSPLTTTTYFVSITNSTCPYPTFDTVKVNVFQLQSLALPKSDTTICKGQTIKLCTTAPQNGVQYTWSPATYCSNVNDLNATFTPTSDINYTLDANAGFCKVSYLVKLKTTVLGIELLVGDTVKICKGDSVALTIKSTFGLGTFFWEENNKTISNNGNIKVAPKGNTIYTLKKIFGGCIVKDSTQVLVFANLEDIELKGNDMMCKNGVIGIKASATNSTNLQYQWTITPNQENMIYGDSIAIKVTSDFTLKLNVSNGVCSKEITKDIKMGLPNTFNGLKLVGDTSVCKGSTVVLKVVPSTNLKYNWQITPTQNFINGKDSIKLIADTTFIVNVTISDGVCALDLSQKVADDKKGNITLSATKTDICEGDIIEITAKGNITETLDWEPTVKCVDNVPNCTKIQVSPISNQTYTFLNKNINGCPTNPSISITVKPSPSIAYPGKTKFCIGDTLPSKIVLNQAPDSNTSYTWQSSDDLTFGTSTEAAPTIKPTKSATYKVTMKKGSCTNEDKIEIIVANQGYITVSNDTVICPHELPITLSYKTSLNKNDIVDSETKWTAGGNTVSNLINPSAPITVYNLVLTYKAGTDFCTFQDNVTVFLKPKPEGNITLNGKQNATIQIYCGEEVTFNYEPSNNLKVKNYEWIFDTEREDKVVKDISFSKQQIIQPTKVILKLTGENGCINTITSLEIDTIIPTLQFPSVFLPDGTSADDQVFKYFIPTKISDLITVDLVQFTIFDRWGEIVFKLNGSNEEITKDWNGKYRNVGNELPQDVYRYQGKFKLADEVLRPFSGEIMLLR